MKFFRYFSSFCYKSHHVDQLNHSVSKSLPCVRHCKSDRFLCSSAEKKKNGKRENPYEDTVTLHIGFSHRSTSPIFYVKHLMPFCCEIIQCMFVLVTSLGLEIEAWVAHIPASALRSWES
jgi:hypothetical protein